MRFAVWRRTDEGRRSRLCPDPPQRGHVQHPFDSLVIPDDDRDLCTPGSHLARMRLLATASAGYAIIRFIFMRRDQRGESDR